MSNELDERIGSLLRTDAPPARDPLFRIGLIERRERQRYQRRQRVLLVAAAVLVVLFVVIMASGGFALPGAAMLRAGLAVAFVLALVAAVMFSARGVRQVISTLRGS